MVERVPWLEGWARRQGTSYLQGMLCIVHFDAMQCCRRASCGRESTTTAAARINEDIIHSSGSREVLDSEVLRGEREQPTALRRERHPAPAVRVPGCMRPQILVGYLDPGPRALGAVSAGPDELRGAMVALTAHLRLCLCSSGQRGCKIAAGKSRLVFWENVCEVSFRNLKIDSFFKCYGKYALRMLYPML